jgi:hypothetical protein
LRRFWLDDILSVFILRFGDELFFNLFFLYFFDEELEGPLLLNEVPLFLVDGHDEENDD